MRLGQEPRVDRVLGEAERREPGPEETEARDRRRKREPEQGQILQERAT